MITHASNPIHVAYAQASEQEQSEFRAWVIRAQVRRAVGLADLYQTLEQHYNASTMEEREDFVRSLGARNRGTGIPNSAVIEAAIEVVTEETGLKWTTILRGRHRTAERTRARTLISGILRASTSMSFPEIASVMGRKYHSAICEQCDRFSALPTEEQLDYVVRTLRVAATMRTEAT